MTALMTVACIFGLTACGEKKVKVGSQSATTGYKFAECLTGVEATAYDTHALAAQDMKNGKVSYVICDGATADSIVSKISGIKKVNIPLTSENYAIGVNPSKAELLTQINGILASKATEIQAILNKSSDDFVEVASAEYDANKDQFVVATNAEFEPFEYVSGTSFKGIDMEIAKLIADELGKELVIKDMAFDAVVTAVATANGEVDYDVAMAGLTVTAARKKSIKFTNAYYTEAQYLLCLDTDKSFDECATVLDVLSIVCGK